MNKITKEYIESQIDDVTFTPGLGTITHCYITLKSGYIVTGESACVDELNFDASIGERISYDNAFNKLWELFGFELKRKIGGDYVYRLERETEELEDKVIKLDKFLQNNQVKDCIDQEELQNLNSQLSIMQSYLAVLKKRLENAKSKINQSRSH